MNKLKGLNNTSKEYNLYKRLEELIKDTKCGNPDEINHINNYLQNLDNTHWKLLEDVQNKTGKKKRTDLFSRKLYKYY